MTQIQFNNQYISNFNALTNFARKLTQDTMEAEDLVQETALKAFKGIHTFQAGTSFKSWAFTILKNTFITKYNKKKKAGLVNAPIEDFTYALENNYAIKNDALSKMRITEIEDCINTLSEKSKIPFLMHLQGYKYDEIAESLDIPMGTVKSRINFARTKLKTALMKKGISVN